MTVQQFWVVLALVGTGGFGLGVGLVVGAWVARNLRSYARGGREDDPKA